jgi:hypothetical protein
MSARYPGDTQDALSIDDGSPNWWESLDIWLSGADPGVAQPGANTINVRTHLLAGKTFTQSQANCDVYVGNPSLVMTPTAGTIAIGSILFPKAGYPSGGGPQVQTIGWTVPATPSSPTAIDAPGHRCLIARVYPFGTGTPSDFQVPTDQHEGQRNIFIAASSNDGSAGGAGAGTAGTQEGKPMGPNEDGLWEFRVDTTARTRKPGRVIVRAEWANQVSGAELKRLLALLKKRRGFERLAKEPPPSFGFQFKLPARELPPAKIRFIPKVLEAGPKESKDGVPRYEARIMLRPRRISRIGVTADLRKTPVGQAQVFHVEQIGFRGRREGGLTVIFLRVR